MRAACRHCRLHHTKRNLNPLKAPGRWAPISSRTPVTRVMRTAAPSNQTTQPAFTSQTCHAVLWRRRSAVAYTSWLLGVKEESEGPAPLESSSATRCHARAQGSDLNSKMAASQELTALQRSGCNSTWPKIRPPVGCDRCSAASRDRAARHYPSYPQLPCETARYYRRLPVMT
jgi:hypothetical protein